MDQLSRAKNFIKEKIVEGIDHFYIVSTHVNIKFAKELAERVCRELNFARVFAEEHEGIFRGQSTKMFCSLVSFYHG